MSIKLMSNSIPLGNSKSFEDLIAAAVSSKEAKTVKVASINTEAKKTEAKKAEAKEDEVKEDEAKKAEVKEDEVKEDEVKEDEVKEDEVKEMESSSSMESAKDCKASEGIKAIKIAKLNDKTRSMLQKYWSSIYPKEYVDAILSEQ